MTRKDEIRLQEILNRGYPYPWDFWGSSNSGFAGEDYEAYWAKKQKPDA